MRPKGQVKRGESSTRRSTAVTEYFYISSNFIGLKNEGFTGLVTYGPRGCFRYKRNRRKSHRLSFASTNAYS